MHHSARPTLRWLTLAAIGFACLPLVKLRGDSELCGTVADDLVAARVGLEREWVVQVPFDSGRWRLDRVAVGRDLVVAQARDGLLAAITTGVDGSRPGVIRWCREGDGSRFPIETAGIGPATVTVVHGSTLTAIDAVTGRTIWNRPLPSLAAASAVPSSGWIYAPIGAGSIAKLAERPETISVAEALASGDEATAEKLIERWLPADRYETIGSPGRLTQSPVPYENGVLWCTDDGLLLAEIIEDDSSPRLEFDLGSPVSGPPVVRGSDVFVATQAGDIARIARAPSGFRATAGIGRGPDGEEVTYTGWHTVIDEQPEGGPLVGDGTVIVSLGPSGLAAFNAQTGDLLWQSRCLGTPLAIIDGRAWCVDATGFLSARDLGTGRRVARLRLGEFTVPVVDPSGERLVLASPRGLVVSLAGRRTRSAQPPAALPPPSGTGDAAAPDDR